MPGCSDVRRDRSSSWDRFDRLNMPLTENQISLAETIDEYVEQLYRNGGDDEELLMTMHAHMETFKQLLDSSTQQEMNELCQRYDGFYIFASLLERLAEGIANGTFPVPE